MWWLVYIFGKKESSSQELKHVLTPDVYCVHPMLFYRHKGHEKIRVLMRQEKTMKVRISNSQRRTGIAI